MIYRIFMILIVVGVIAFVVWLVHTAKVRHTTQNLRAELKSRENQIVKLKAENKALSAEPSVREDRLRGELAGYVNLVDMIQYELSRDPDPLTLSSPEERLGNIIQAYRPERSI